MCNNDWNMQKNIIIKVLYNNNKYTWIDIISHASRLALTKAARSGSLIRICLPRRCTGSSPCSIQRRTVFGLTFKHAATSGIENRGGTVAVSCLVISPKPSAVRASLARLGGREGGRGSGAHRWMRQRGHHRPTASPLASSRLSRSSPYRNPSRGSD